MLRFVLAFLVATLGLFGLGFIMFRPREGESRAPAAIALSIYCLILAIGIAYYGELAPQTIEGGPEGIKITLQNEIRQTGEQVKKEVVDQIQANVKTLFSQAKEIQASLAEQNKTSLTTLAELTEIQREMAPRHLRGRSRERFIRALRDVGVKMNISQVLVTSSESEVIGFSIEVEEALVSAGWLDAVPKNYTALEASLEGISIGVKDHNKLLPEEKALKDAFRLAGFPQVNVKDAKDFQLLIGSKPQSAHRR